MRLEQLTRPLPTLADHMSKLSREQLRAVMRDSTYMETWKAMDESARRQRQQGLRQLFGEVLAYYEQNPRDPEVRSILTSLIVHLGPAENDALMRVENQIAAMEAQGPWVLLIPPWEFDETSTHIMVYDSLPLPRWFVFPDLKFMTSPECYGWVQRSLGDFSIKPPMEKTAEEDAVRQSAKKMSASPDYIVSEQFINSTAFKLILNSRLRKGVCISATDVRLK
jgi:hypothetical protein